MIKALMFDLDGTVADTLDSLAWSANTAMARIDGSLKPQPAENFRFYAGEGAAVMLRRCLADAGDPEGTRLEEMLPVYREVFKEGCLKDVKTYFDMPDVLKELKAEGFLLTVCTNKAQKNAESILRMLYGPDMFAEIMGERPDHKRKPSPEGPLMICSHLSLRPEEVLYAGDTKTDMETALAAGFHAVGVTWGFRSREELISSGAQHLIDRPRELIALAREL